jgi:hypothetical protein
VRAAQVLDDPGDRGEIIRNPRTAVRRDQGKSVRDHRARGPRAQLCSVIHLDHRRSHERETKCDRVRQMIHIWTLSTMAQDSRAAMAGPAQGAPASRGRAGQENLQEARPVLHLPQPGPDQCGQLAHVVLDQPPGFSVDPLTGKFWVLCGFELRFVPVTWPAQQCLSAHPMGAVRVAGVARTGCRGGARRDCHRGEDKEGAAPTFKMGYGGVPGYFWPCCSRICA